MRFVKPCEEHWNRLRKELYEMGYGDHMAGSEEELVDQFEGQDITVVAVMNLSMIAIRMQAFEEGSEGCPICLAIDKLYHDAMTMAATNFVEKH